MSQTTQQQQQQLSQNKQQQQDAGQQSFYSVLITQCIQQDYIGEIEFADKPPTPLHAGYQAALRLLGRNPEIDDHSCGGPIMRIMLWARSQPTESFEILHIRDWHDPDAPNSKDNLHLKIFGTHCVKNSEGAKLVLNLDAEVESRPNERYVNSNGLNDFVDTDLEDILRNIIKKANGKPIRIGIIGVWTDVKVMILAYELKTRFGFEVATCSALTASKIRQQHFEALDKMSNLLDTYVTHSIGDFMDWLIPGSSTRLPCHLMPQCMETCACIEIYDKDHTKEAGGKPKPVDSVLNEDQKMITCYLYRSSEKLTLIKVNKGLSGSLVFYARSIDKGRYEQAPSVLKIGPRKLMAQERINFEKVQDLLGGHYAPSIRDFIDYGDMAGIKFSYASMSEGKIRSFESVYKGYVKADEDTGCNQKNAGRKNCGFEHIRRLLHTLFEDILAKFWTGATLEKLVLLDFYDFNGTGWAWGKGGSDNPRAVRERIDKIMGEGHGKRETLEFPGGFTARNVADFLEYDLPRIQRNPGEQHYVCYVHGDLHGGNVLIDSSDNIWLIDFFFAGRGHILKDIIKLENDLLYQFTSIDNEEQLAEALRITRALLDVTDLQEDLPLHKQMGLQTPRFVHAWNAIRTLRQITGRMVQHDRHPRQVSIVLLRYALHMLCFDHVTTLQKQWALAAACGFAEKLRHTFLGHQTLEVGWIPREKLPTKGKLGITLLPGRRDRGRNLQDDLTQLRNVDKIDRILNLCTPDELEFASVISFHAEAQRYGIKYMWSGFIDHGTPTMSQLESLVDVLLKALYAGENVLIVSYAGLGRSGTVAAAVLLKFGLSEKAKEGIINNTKGNGGNGVCKDALDAIKTIQQVRGKRGIETEKQKKLVFDFAKKLCGHDTGKD